MMYANENKGFLVSAETGPAKVETNWQDGWVIEDATRANTPEAIRAGALWKGASNPEVYRCPSSLDKFNFRSYSISSRLNGATSWAGTTGPMLRKLTQVKPSTLVFIEEYDSRTAVDGSSNQQFNQGSFLLYQDKGMLKYVWGDLPAFFHRTGTVLSFADGHVEYVLWKDQRTFKALRDQRQDGNNDIIELKRMIYGPPAQ
jgi:prepilin-type processing-associated H-X9-DG protein